MPVLEVASLLLLAALGWFWWDSLKSRDLAMQSARQACMVKGLQLLDETVAIASVKLARDDDSQLQIQRTYHFEFSDTGNNRQPGSVVTLGKQVTRLELGLVADLIT